MKRTRPLVQQLKQAKLKVTKARIGVLEILENIGQPLDVLEIVKGLEKKHIAADQATVYRILDAFTKINLIGKVEFQEGKFRYELIGQKHHHVICENCGKIEDVECPVADLEKAIAKKHNFLIKRHTLEFFGVCSRCQLLVTSP